MRGWSALGDVHEEPNAGLSSLSLLLPGCSRGRLVGWQFMEKRRAGGMCAGLSQGHADCLGTRAKASCGWEDRLIARGDGALCGEGGATPGQGLLFVFQVA